MDDLNLKSKLKAIFNIINEMDDMELKDMASSEEEEDPKKITMVSIKAKPIEEDMMGEEDMMEDVAETETPEPEEEEKEDPNSALGRLRKRLQGSV
jgi:hypothetical protein